MDEKMKMMDFQMYKTIFELALDSYEVELQGLNPDSRERYIESISGVKPIALEKSTAEIIGNLKRKIPHIFNVPNARYTVIVNRHFDALEALSEDEKDTLSFDELDRRWQEYISILDDAERAIVENEPQRLESSLRSAIEGLACQAEGKYLEILIKAVERRIERQQSKGCDARHIAYDRMALNLLKECLPDWPEAPRSEQPEKSPAELHEKPSADKAVDSTAQQKGRKAISFRLLQECFDNATEEDRKKYFLSGSGRHGKQEEYFFPMFTTIKKEFNGVLAISTFIRNDVRDFKNDLKKRIADKENG
jgi:hypothetical protein